MYTYDVYWDTSDITWASRWDAYLRMPGGKVHWFSILNSLMVVVVMSCIVAMIMMRTIRRDLQRYEQLLVDSGEDREGRGKRGCMCLGGGQARESVVCVYKGKSAGRGGLSGIMQQEPYQGAVHLPSSGPTCQYLPCACASWAAEGTCQGCFAPCAASLRVCLAAHSGSHRRCCSVLCRRTG